MFRKMLGFGGGKKMDGVWGSERDSVRGSGNKKSKGKKNAENVISRIGDIRNNMEEEHFASGVTKEKVSMADKLDSHKAGSLFKYAVIGNAPSDERTGFIQRLKTYKAPSSVSNLNLSDIPAIRLYGDAIEFPMTDALKTAGNHKTDNYCLIDSVLIHFVPLDSFLNDKSVITVQLNDFRKVSGTAVRVARIDNTMAYNLLFCLDFCVETRDLNRMTLSFACPQKDFQDGVAWGAVKVVAQVAFLSFPKRMPVIETMAVTIFADTDLQEYDWDPREMDAVLGPQALKGLRDAHKRGEIENLTLPRDDKVDHTAARTIMGQSLEDSSPEDAIMSMKRAALERGRSMIRRKTGDSSNSNLAGPSEYRKSSLKKPSDPFDDSIESVHSDEDPLGPEDSMSNVGSIDSTKIGSPKSTGGKRIVKFSG